MKISLGGHFYRSDSLPISAQECVNLYLNIPQVPTSNQETLLPCAGIKQVTTAGTLYNRANHTFKGAPYFVQGPDLYRVDESLDGEGNLVYSSVKVNGAVEIPGTKRVMIADNGADGNQMVIVVPESDDQFNAFIYTTAGGLVQVSDSDFDGPVSSVRFIDGYFSYTKKNGQIFLTSDLRDGLSYNALDTGSAEADPDSVVGQWVLNFSTLIVFGQETFEPFRNVGGAGFPFLRVQGGTQSKGLCSAFAVEEVGGVMVFLGKSANETPAVWASSGGVPVKLSSTAIDQEISQYPLSVISQTYCVRYSIAGGQFVDFTFPGKKTFTYDFTAKDWHTKVSYIDGFDNKTSRVLSVCDAYAKLFVGDMASNKIGVIDTKTYTEFGETIRRWFITPHLEKDGYPFWVNAVELLVESGVGLTSGQGSDPKISMSFSKDGGRTYSNKWERSVGKIGEYFKRLVWEGINRTPRMICFRFDMSDPVKYVIRGLEARIE
jgi:hypothetical protein